MHLHGSWPLKIGLRAVGKGDDMDTDVSASSSLWQCHPQHHKHESHQAKVRQFVGPCPYRSNKGTSISTTSNFPDQAEQN
jgi:hypothetical protein